MGEAVAAATTAGTRHTAHDTRGTRGNGIRGPWHGPRTKGYLLYGPLGRRVRALRLLEQRQNLPESFLLWLPRHFHRVFQQHHCNAQPAFSDLADKRKLPTALSLAPSFLRPPSPPPRPLDQSPRSLSLTRARAPSGPWSREGAPRPSSAPAALTEGDSRVSVPPSLLLARPAFPLIRENSTENRFAKLEIPAATARRREASPARPLAVPRAWERRSRKRARRGVLKPDSRPVRISGVARIGAGKRALRPTTEMNRDRCGVD